MKIGNCNFELGSKTFIVGIINVTPDSFSDGGQFSTVKDVVEYALKLIDDGADIIEVGGESSRPGALQVSIECELERVIPVIKELSKNISVPIAVDTCKCEVAIEAIKAGASIINDIWGFKNNFELAKVCAKYEVVCVLMHNRDNRNYSDNIIEDIISDLNESVNIALKNGVNFNKIILDPGIGFAKDAILNYEVLRNLEKLSSLNLPIMLGASRKKFLGSELNLTPEQRDEATIATSVIGIEKQCDFIRVHNVKKNKRAVVIADQVYRK